MPLHRSFRPLPFYNHRSSALWYNQNQIKLEPLFSVPPFDTYLFDLDGTLIDTKSLILKCFKEVLKSVPDVSIEDHQILQQIGIPLHQQFANILKNSVMFDQIEILIERYTQFQTEFWDKEIAVFEGAIATLHHLRDQNKKMAIVTSRREFTTTLYLKGLGLDRFFDAVVTPELTLHHKPHPAPVLEAIKRLGADPKTTLMIGDAPFDIESGKRAGCSTAYVLWGGADWKNFPYQPDYIIERFSDLTSSP